ncbi:MAG: formyltetrahydrofolate deformylase, partial [Pseudoalteromonas tetraodonis]|nr:formyltetrahydrofolate deformylase [Pseudoalteromonas tetraodonis]
MSYILTTQCADDIGLIAKITGLCNQHNLNIIRNNEFVDKDAQRFFMRTELTGEPHAEFLSQLSDVLPAGAKVALHGEEKTKVVLLATKEAHCLGGMLLKQFEQALNIEILAVIANYPTLEPLVKGFNIPFHVVSHEGLTRSEHDEKVGDLIASYNPD